MELNVNYPYFTSAFLQPVPQLHCNRCFSLFWLSDIKQLYRLTGVDNKPTVFLFSDTQIVKESFLEDINNILSSGEVPNLYKQDEFVEVCGFSKSFSASCLSIYFMYV